MGQGLASGWGLARAPEGLRRTKFSHIRHSAPQMPILVAPIPSPHGATRPLTPLPRRRGGGRRRGAARSKHPKRPAPEPLHPSATPPDIEGFDHWPLHEGVLSAIADMGIVKPTPIQALAIGPVLEGKDVIAKAETGTGKTLAFGAPMISKVDPERRTVLGLVLSPTRELAEQVHAVMEKLGAAREMRTALIVGGEDMVPQVKALQAGAQVVVGTPGRVLDLMGQGFLNFPWTEFVVLDEADKMLEIGFIDDVKKILDAANEYRQTLLFSATFPPALLDLARSYTTDPAEIATASGVSTVDTISQRFVAVDEDEKAQLLSRLIEDSGDDDIFLVFCDRRTDVDRLLRRLERRRFPVKALHGGYDQAARFRVMNAFREKGVKALIATDVASRGLDVAHVTYVINYSAPRDAADYTHRIGRTGRAGRCGTAISFVSPSDRRRWAALRRSTPFDIEEAHSVRELLAAPGGERAAKRRPRRDSSATSRGNRPTSERTPDRSQRREEKPPQGASTGKPKRRRDSKRSTRSSDRSNRRAEAPAPRERKSTPGASSEGSRARERKAPPASGGGFGAGLEEEPKSPTRRSPKRSQPAAPRRPEPDPTPDPPAADPPPGGFGAGL